jgi:hypothetical protein
VTGGETSVSTGFIPSAHAFAFDNSWPAAPGMRLAGIGIGNAAKGLCGGMVFAALDYWHANRVPPAARPEPGSPLYRFIVRRLVGSWHLPGGIARYYRWMARPDADLALRTLTRHWPRVRGSLDDGVPVPLGVVTVAGRNPLRLGANHQVLAYAYTAGPSAVTLRVYDPNRGADDDVRIGFDKAARRAAAAFENNLGISLPVRGFFVTGYRPASPPG